MKMQDRDLTDMARYAPPYTYVVPVAVNIADQTFAGEKIVALQTTTAGTVYVDTEDVTNQPVYMPAGIPVGIAVTKIYHAGTSGAIQSGCINALGFLA